MKIGKLMRTFCNRFGQLDQKGHGLSYGAKRNAIPLKWDDCGKL